MPTTPLEPAYTACPLCGGTTFLAWLCLPVAVYLGPDEQSMDVQPPTTSQMADMEISCSECHQGKVDAASDPAASAVFAQVRAEFVNVLDDLEMGPTEATTRSMNRKRQGGRVDVGALL